MQNNCVIIALEGPDKMGKTTQAKCLAESLSGSFYQKIPAKDSVTYEKIYQMLDDGDAVEYPHYFQTMNGVNRLLWQKEKMPKLKEEYNYIILDRWKASTVVYGMGIGMTSAQCQVIIKDLIEPDLTFVFTGKPFNRDGVDDAYEKNDDLQKSVRQGYVGWANSKNKTISVGNIGTIQETTDFILQKVREYENGK